MKSSVKVVIVLNVILIGLSIFSLKAQTAMVVPPSNRSTATLEKNLLFYADSRYVASQQGSIALNLAALFDGNYLPNYSMTGIDESNPYVVLVENLPAYHVQAGGWIGWTTRYYNPVKFKIEVYNVYDYGGLAGYPAPNTWITVADEDNYTGFGYIADVQSVAPSKIRYTFYKASGPGNSIGISELFFIHPEATTAFDGLMVKYDHNGNVSIGTGNPNGGRLEVKGNIHAQQVTVDMNNWADYVFKKEYSLTPLAELKTYIEQHQHLPEIPSEKEIAEKGLNLGDINAKLLKKIEELTLYLIEKDKKDKEQQQQMDQLKEQVSRISVSLEQKK